jgi:hypothetical protein
MRQYGLVSDEAPQPPDDAETIEATLIYANSTRASGTPWDLSIDFAYVGGDGASKHGVRVVMSWEQASAVKGLLTRMISRYEAELGEVRPFVAEAEAVAAAAAAAESETIDDREGGTP